MGIRVIDISARSLPRAMARPIDTGRGDRVVPRVDAALGIFGESEFRDKLNRQESRPGGLSISERY